MTYYTAPTFTNYTRLTDAYLKNGKMYFDVKNPNTGNVRSVRAYTAVEFNKAYPDKAVAVPKRPEADDGLKQARGFKFGDITLVRTKDEEWLRSNKACRYATDIGWYVASEDEMPGPVPADLKRAKLSWDRFLNDFWNKKD